MYIQADGLIKLYFKYKPETVKCIKLNKISYDDQLKRVFVIYCTELSSKQSMYARVYI